MFLLGFQEKTSWNNFFQFWEVDKTTSHSQPGNNAFNIVLGLFLDRVERDVRFPGYRQHTNTAMQHLRQGRESGHSHAVEFSLLRRGLTENNVCLVRAVRKGGRALTIRSLAHSLLSWWPSKGLEWIFFLLLLPSLAWAITPVNIRGAGTTVGSAPGGTSTSHDLRLSSPGAGAWMASVGRSAFTPCRAPVACRPTSRTRAARCGGLTQPCPFPLLSALTWV